MKALESFSDWEKRMSDRRDRLHDKNACVARYVWDSRFQRHRQVIDFNCFSNPEKKWKQWPYKKPLYGPELLDKMKIDSMCSLCEGLSKQEIYVFGLPFKKTRKLNDVLVEVYAEPRANSYCDSCKTRIIRARKKIKLPYGRKSSEGHERFVKSGDSELIRIMSESIVINQNIKKYDHQH